MKRVLILGGGFGGIYAELEFEKRQDPDFEVTLISQDNFFLFTPMLHEVAASDLDLTHIVNRIRKMLRYVHFFEGEVRSVDVVKHEVVVSHGSDQHTHSLEYDDVVFALGSVTNFYDIPNLAETAVAMKSLGDAIRLRNLLIERLEEADAECAANDRISLLTFVVAGGGFAGVETIGSMNDFLKEALPYYPNLRPEMMRVVLVHPEEFVLTELGQELGRYATCKLTERGIEIRPNRRPAWDSGATVLFTPSGMGVDAGGTNSGNDAALDRCTGERRPRRYRKLCQARPDPARAFSCTAAGV